MVFNNLLANTEGLGFTHMSKLLYLLLPLRNQKFCHHWVPDPHDQPERGLHHSHSLETELVLARPEPRPPPVPAQVTSLFSSVSALGVFRGAHQRDLERQMGKE